MEEILSRYFNFSFDYRLATYLAAMGRELEAMELPTGHLYRCTANRRRHSISAPWVLCYASIPFPLVRCSDIVQHDVRQSCCTSQSK